MNSKLRSASGAALMLLILPAIVGLLACLPVPIGDPERSRIDPEISGVWVALDLTGDIGFLAFEPYDKRTWLLTGVPLEESDDVDFADYDLDTYAGLAELIENETVGADGATASEIMLYKVWRTKLGGEWFMTWEPKAAFDDEHFAPDTWFAFRVDKPDEDTVELYMVGGDKFFPDDLEKTRRAYERVIKKNAKDPDLYADDAVTLKRVRPEHLGFFEDLADEVVSYD